MAKMANVHGAENYSFESIRFITNAGAPLPVSIQKFFEDRGTFVACNYGNNETGACTLTCPVDPLHVRAGSAGKQGMYAKVIVVDQQGHEVRPGEGGEVIWRNGGLPFAYYKNRKLTEEMLGVGGPRQGWVYSKDGGTMDEYGNLTITGRIDDMILRGGENVFPVEIENELMKLEKIKDIAVIGMPDPVFGERICAYVTLTEGTKLTFDEVKEFADGQGLAKFKWPERLEIIGEFPMTSSGKIRKKDLRKDIEDKLRKEGIEI
jgi:cyclohexanecarboxylate-CoA ligase/acyl-CoA synthetase